MQDMGDCAEASQPGQVRLKNGRTAIAVSFLEPGTRIATDRVTPDDIAQLDAEVARLQANSCYQVCVRLRATGKGINEALGKCDLVYILAHGSGKRPYLSLGGNPSADVKSPPSIVTASNIWVGACHGQEIVNALNGIGPQRYHTLPPTSFYQDGTAGRHAMIQGLIGELKKLTDTQCDAPKRVCILAGVQQVDIR